MDLGFITGYYSCSPELDRLPPTHCDKVVGAKSGDQLLLMHDSNDALKTFRGILAGDVQRLFHGKGKCRRIDEPVILWTVLTVC